MKQRIKLKQVVRHALDTTNYTISVWSRGAKRAIQKAQGKEFLHFLHIGKTGGSAIAYALEKYSSYTPYVIYIHTHDIKLRDVSVGEGVIFFLRDPISRFVSGFYSRQRQGRPRIQAAWSPDEKIAFENFATPNQLALSLYSTNAAERRRAGDAMKSINHVKNSYWDWFESEEYLVSRLSDIFFIGFQECLDRDFDSLRSKLGLPDHARLPTDPVYAHRNPPNLDKRLDDIAIENLNRWYSDDFRFISFVRESVKRPNIYS